MAFQDFDYLSERRKAEKSKRLKRRIAAAAFSSLMLAAIVAVGVVCVMHSSDNTSGSSGGSGSASSGSPSKSSEKSPQTPSQGESSPDIGSQFTTSDKAIKTVCASTDYESTCKSSLQKAVKEDPKNAQPKDLLKLSIKAALEELRNVIDETASFDFKSKEEMGAYEDCKELMHDAIDELSSSITQATGDNMDKIGSKTPDLNNWLSAVVSYQETCIDGFPDGKLKTQVEKAFKVAKELTSNSLAIVSEASELLSGSGAKRNLLAASGNPGDLDKDGVPHWVDRRMLKGNTDMPEANVVVSQDGSGKYKTINEALAAMPKTYNGRYVIYIKTGVYDETVIVTKKMTNVTMYGDGSQKTVITGNKNFVDGVRTFQTASFAALGEGFMAKAMGFRNTAGPEKHQAVAARVQADKAIFVNCRFEGYQDTLYVQTHRQYYRSCVITGTVDFIFGDASAVLQNCEIIVRKPMDNQQNIVTAQGRSDKRETTGIVIQNCRIEADPTLVPVKTKIKTYLGRPWKEYSRTIIMESSIDDLIQPEGWMPWEGDFALKTLYYAEYGNKGAGASTSSRVNWAGYQKNFKREDATKFTVGTFLEVGWIKEAGAPVKEGLYY